MTKTTKNKTKTAKRSVVASQDLRTWFQPIVKVHRAADNSGGIPVDEVNALHAGTHPGCARHRASKCQETAGGIVFDNASGLAASSSSSSLHDSLLLPIKKPLSLKRAAAPSQPRQYQQRKGQSVIASRSHEGRGESSFSDLLPSSTTAASASSVIAAHEEQSRPTGASAQIPSASIYALRRPPGQLLRCTERFEILGCAPWGQYRDTYTNRLKVLRDPVLQNAWAQWGLHLPPCSFLNSIRCVKPQAPGGMDHVVVGVLYKELARRQSSGAISGCPDGFGDGHTVIYSDGDALWLEDAGQRLRLSLASFMVAQLVTGLVAAVRGRLDAKGAFEVTDVCLPMLPMPRKIPGSISVEICEGQGPFIAFMSGLNFGAIGEHSPALHSASRFLRGHCHRNQDKLLSSAVKWLIICGGTFAEGGALMALEQADTFLAELAGALCVDLVPGRHDPTNLSLPQMPLLPHLFKQARLCKDFRPVTNPYECILDGLRILGHAGQPIEDLLRCARISSPLAALEMSLGAMHLAPTAPDTLAASPFIEHDPFIIENMPHVLFSGCHDEAAHAWNSAPCGGTSTLCLAVPAFHRQPAIVLVSMRDLRDVRTIMFDPLAPSQ